MPIKKSYLEQKWYYRIIKVFLLLFPLLLALFFILNKKLLTGNILQKNILSILQNNIKNIIFIAIGFAAYYLILISIWRIFLYVVFGGLENDNKAANLADGIAPPNQRSRSAAQLLPVIILLIIFAIYGLAQAGYIKLPLVDLNFSQTTRTYGAACASSGGKAGLYGTNGKCYTCLKGTAATNPAGNCSSGVSGIYCCGIGKNDGDGVDGCISTGCGSMWYCSGSYYIGGQEIRVPSLCYPVHPRNVFSGWSGTCRQCP